MSDEKKYAHEEVKIYRAREDKIITKYYPFVQNTMFMQYDPIQLHEGDLYFRKRNGERVQVLIPKTISITTRNGFPEPWSINMKVVNKKELKKTLKSSIREELRKEGYLL